MEVTTACSQYVVEDSHSKVASASLLEIPWFAFDVPERPCVRRKSNSLTGWEPLQSPAGHQTQCTPTHKPPARNKLNYRGISAGSTIRKYNFKHYEDIGEYMKDYRQSHTHKLAGVLPAGFDRPISRTAEGDESVDRLLSTSNSELLHILRHSQRRWRKPEERPLDIEPEEGEDDSKGSEPRWRLTKSKLLNRETSAGSVQSAGQLTESGVKRSQQNEKTSTGLPDPQLERSRTSLDAPKRLSTSHLPSPLLPSRSYQHQRFSPGSKYFMGSTLTKTPQNGLVSAQPQNGRAGAPRSLFSNSSTHSAISSLKHQVWFGEDGRAYMSLANQLNVLFKSYKQVA